MTPDQKADSELLTLIYTRDSLDAGAPIPIVELLLQARIITPEQHERLTVLIYKEHARRIALSEAAQREYLREQEDNKQRWWKVFSGREIALIVAVFTLLTLEFATSMLLVAG